MNRKPDEEKGFSSPSLRKFQLPPKGSFQWYAYLLVEYANDWRERNPKKIIADKEKPISYVQSLVHELNVKYEEFTELRIEEAETDQISEKIVKVLSQLTALELTLKNLENNPAIPFPEDFVSKLTQVRKNLKLLAEMIEPLAE